MSHLTIEKMDKINFLVTEVSLECLGNKFYDIYGKQNKSLLGLISVNTLKSNSTSSDSESDLWTSLTAEKKPIIKDWVQTIKNYKVAEPTRKRRASFSTTNNEPDDQDDPESLLMPMANVRKAAKITQRRSTISVQLAKQQHRKSPAVTKPNKTRREFQIQPMTNAAPTVSKPYSTNRVETAKIAAIKQNLKRDINMRNNAMRLLSESQEEKYRTLNINANMDDFYRAEKKSLFSQCNTLIQFIKFIQENDDNATKLGHISQAILELQKEF